MIEPERGNGSSHFVVKETMPTLLSLEDSVERVREGMENRALRLSGRVGKTLADYVGRPGKMLRARFCLLLGMALGVDPKKTETAAKAMEFVHNASLLHDDCVDHADLRRGIATPNALFGNTVALLLGDLSFSQGLEEAIDISPRAPEDLVTTVREMAVGELQEEFLKGSVEVSIEAYMGIAARKTGALFEWCGKVLSEISPLPHEEADPPRLALSAGILLQVVDDIHDFLLDEDVSGKPVAQDMLNRRLTLPCILALENPKTRDNFLSLWSTAAQDSGSIKKAVDFVRENGFLEESRVKGREIVDSMKALCRDLPSRSEGRNLSLFIEMMARREF